MAIIVKKVGGLTAFSLVPQLLLVFEQEVQQGSRTRSTRAISRDVMHQCVAS